MIKKKKVATKAAPRRPHHHDHHADTNHLLRRISVGVETIAEVLSDWRRMKGFELSDVERAQVMEHLNSSEIASDDLQAKVRKIIGLE
jgi:hypothetical protein